MLSDEKWACGKLQAYRITPQNGKGAPSLAAESQSKHQVWGGQLIRQFAQAAQHEAFEWINGPSHNVKRKPEWEVGRELMTRRLVGFRGPHDVFAFYGLGGRMFISDATQQCQ